MDLATLWFFIVGVLFVGELFLVQHLRKKRRETAREAPPLEA